MWISAAGSPDADWRACALLAASALDEARRITETTRPDMVLEDVAFAPVRNQRRRLP